MLINTTRAVLISTSGIFPVYLLKPWVNLYIYSMLTIHCDIMYYILYYMLHCIRANNRTVYTDIGGYSMVFIAGVMQLNRE